VPSSEIHLDVDTKQVLVVGTIRCDRDEELGRRGILGNHHFLGDSVLAGFNKAFDFGVVLLPVSGRDAALISL